MHPRVLAEKNAVAHDRIRRAAEELSTRFGVDFAGFPVMRAEPAVLVMKERESIADLLEAVLQATEPAPKSRKKAAQDQPETEE